MVIFGPENCRRIFSAVSGKKGCRVKSTDADQPFAGYSVKATDTVGAGDTFNAAFVVMYLEGKNLADCGKFANAAAALKVNRGKFPTRQEEENFLIHH